MHLVDGMTLEEVARERACRLGRPQALAHQRARLSQLEVST